MAGDTLNAPLTPQRRRSARSLPWGLLVAGAVIAAAWLLQLPLLLIAGLAAFLALPIARHFLRASGNTTRALEAAVAERTRQLSERNEQLRLINHLTSLLAEENSREGVAGAVGQFLIEEMGAAEVAYWRPGPDGEPDGPWLSFPEGSFGGDVRSQEGAAARRAIFARAAARAALPLALDLAAPEPPRPLDPARPPPGEFVLYLPLPGSIVQEGLLEISAGGSTWGSARWEIVQTLAFEIGAALQRARHFEELREQADLDYVSGLFNHRYMQSYLQQLLQTAAARKRTLALLLMDVDNFKRFNDTYGHSVGDRVLQLVGGQLKLMADRIGTVGRFGGDEFIVVLRGQSRQQAQAYAQAFQDWLPDAGFKTAGDSVPIFVSCGVAVFPDDADRRQELLAVADARLYESKNSGSRVVSRSRRRAPRSGPTLGVFGLLESLVTSVDRRDNYTRAHCETVAEYAALLGQEIGLSPTAQRVLRLASLLHDVGKICIPDHILRKSTRLTGPEFAVIRHHVAIAQHLIVDVPNAVEVRTLALHHHERFDGRGYPDGLRGEAIPYLARVLAVADAFSAITLDRPYRRGLPPQEAYAELQRVAGSQLDPQLVEVFGRVVARLLEDAPVVAPVPA